MIELWSMSKDREKGFYVILNEVKNLMNSTGHNFKILLLADGGTQNDIFRESLVSHTT